MAKVTEVGTELLSINSTGSERGHKWGDPNSGLKETQENKLIKLHIPENHL